MRASLLLVLLPLLAGCPSDTPIQTTDRVDLLLFTPNCEPEIEPPYENVIGNPSGLTLSWDVLCMRDEAPTDWFAIKVSRWEDRADDLWNVWYVDPDRRSVSYGQLELPGAQVPENPDSPLAQERVPPRELVAGGEYRVEVWAVPGNVGDALIGEARLTVLDPDAS